MDVKIQCAVHSETKETIYIEDYDPCKHKGFAICPDENCGAVLAGKQGNINRWHFSHLSKNGGNNGGNQDANVANLGGYGCSESSLHKIGKTELSLQKKISIKSYQLKDYPQIEIQKDKLGFDVEQPEHIKNNFILSCTLIIVSAEIEKRVGNRIVDVYAMAKYKKLTFPILFEVLVSHTCDKEKIKDLDDLDQTTVEISLKRFYLDRHKYTDKKVTDFKEKLRKEFSIYKSQNVLTVSTEVKDKLYQELVDEYNTTVERRNATVDDYFKSLEGGAIRLPKLQYNKNNLVECLPKLSSTDRQYFFISLCEPEFPTFDKLVKVIKVGHLDNVVNLHLENGVLPVVLGVTGDVDYGSYLILDNSNSNKDSAKLCFENNLSWGANKRVNDFFKLKVIPAYKRHTDEVKKLKAISDQLKRDEEERLNQLKRDEKERIKNFLTLEEAKIKEEEEQMEEERKLFEKRVESERNLIKLFNKEVSMCGDTIKYNYNDQELTDNKIYYHSIEFTLDLLHPLDLKHADIIKPEVDPYLIFNMSCEKWQLMFFYNLMMSEQNTIDNDVIQDCLLISGIKSKYFKFNELCNLHKAYKDIINYNPYSCVLPVNVIDHYMYLLSNEYFFKLVRNNGAQVIYKKTYKSDALSKNIVGWKNRFWNQKKECEKTVSTEERLGLTRPFI